jgi:hypothetical protein
MKDAWTERLSEYLDGNLDPADRVAIEAHLPGCRDCAATLAELRSVVERAGRLDQAGPATDLWPGIAARIAAEARDAAPVPAATATAPRVITLRPGREWRFSLPQLAAAAVTLMLVSGGAVWFAMRQGPLRSEVPVAGLESPDPYAVATGDAAGAVVRASLVDNPRYDDAVAELEHVLAEGRGQLDSSTVRVLEQNLDIINRAVAQARRAVASDPANPYLRSHLTATMHRKADFLRRATVLASAG